MFAVEMRDDATNKRVGSRAGWWSLPESCRFRVWLVVLALSGSCRITPHTLTIMRFAKNKFGNSD